MSDLEPYQDPKHEWNGAEYLTGKKCIEGCGREAGTAWSAHWCQPCNAQRLDKISGQMENILASFTKAK